MTQRAWHIEEIGRIAATLLVMAPSEDFAAGVLALANAIGAPVPAQRRVARWDVVVIDGAGAGLEVTR